MPVGYNYTIGDTVNLHVFKLKLKYNPLSVPNMVFTALPLGDQGCFFELGSPDDGNS